MAGACRSPELGTSRSIGIQFGRKFTGNDVGQMGIYLSWSFWTLGSTGESRSNEGEVDLDEHKATHPEKGCVVVF